MTKELIMKRLAAGEDAQVIADEMAKLINEAVAAHEEEVAKEQVKKERENQAAMMLEDAVIAINSYVDLVHPELDFPPLTAKELREIINQSLPLLKAGTKMIKTAKKVTDPNEVDKILNDFLKAMKL